MMERLQKIWRQFSPREQWMAVLVALTLLGSLWLLLGHDGLSRELRRLEAARMAADARTTQAVIALDELRARAANRPDAALLHQLEALRQERDQRKAALERDTAALIRPQVMQQVLQDLLRSRPGLRLHELASFTELVEPPVSEMARDAVQGELGAQSVRLYRHGVRLRLEGSYFELRDYLRAIEAGRQQLFWDRLEYQVKEAGPGRARIELTLYTLGQEEGWIGV